jgi:hypothetical protein
VFSKRNLKITTIGNIYICVYSTYRQVICLYVSVEIIFWFMPRSSPWRWGTEWTTETSLHGVTPHNTSMWIFTTVITPYLSYILINFRWWKRNTTTSNITYRNIMVISVAVIGNAFRRDFNKSLKHNPRWQPWAVQLTKNLLTFFIKIFSHHQGNYLNDISIALMFKETFYKRPRAAYDEQFNTMQQKLVLCVGLIRADDELLCNVKCEGVRKEDTQKNWGINKREEQRQI